MSKNRPNKYLVKYWNVKMKNFNQTMLASLSMPSKINLLNMSDKDIIILYTNTTLTNNEFCNYASHLSKRSAGSIRAILILNHIYRLECKND